MSEAKMGDSVRVHYTGTLDDGTTFDSSAGRDLTFEIELMVSVAALADRRR